MKKTKLIFVGASVRWHLEQAARRNSNIQGFDLFSDWDAQKSGRITQVEKLELISEILPPQDRATIVLGGGMENLPHVVLSLASQHHVLAPPSHQIKRLKDPFELQSACQRFAISFPEMANSDLESDKNWLVKPFRSCGGSSIRFFDHKEPVEDCYLQLFAPGISHGCVFYADENFTKLVGTTRQLSGDKNFTSLPFAYCGSVTSPIEGVVRSEIVRIGEALAREFDLRGVFGIDVVVQGNNVTLIEVNPRLTSSCEVLELSKSCSNLIQLHLASFGLDNLPEVCQPNRFAGKAIVYHCGSEKIIIDATKQRWLIGCCKDEGRLADIPTLGTCIQPGQPICSILTNGSSEAVVYAQLVEFASIVRTHLATTSAS